MRIKLVNAIIATLLAFLLSWWLWIMGVDYLQKCLLALLGGFIIECGLLGSLGIEYENPRSGMQVKIICVVMTTLTFLLNCVYSFFTFSVAAYCIPMGIIWIICLLMALKIYNSKQ